MLTAALDGLVERFSLAGERLGEVAGGAVLRRRAQALARPRRGGCSRREPSERATVVRYEWPCPGNLLHMDVKKLWT